MTLAVLFSILRTLSFVLAQHHQLKVSPFHYIVILKEEGLCPTSFMIPQHRVQPMFSDKHSGCLNTDSNDTLAYKSH